MALTFNVPSSRDEWRRAALVSLAVLVLAGVVVALFLRAHLDQTLQPPGPSYYLLMIGGVIAY